MQKSRKNNYFPALKFNNAVDDISELFQKDQIHSTKILASELNDLVTNNVEILPEPSIGYSRIIKEIMVYGDYKGSSTTIGLGTTVIIGMQNDVVIQEVLNSIVLTKPQYYPYKITLPSTELIFINGFNLRMWATGSFVPGTTDITITVIYRDLPISQYNK